MWKEIEIEFKFFFRWIASQVINGLFFLVWIAIQYIVSQLISLMPLSGLDRWMFWAFQILFAISTFIPVGAYIYRDIHKIIRETAREVQRTNSENV
ncbi:hypothetical protein KC963_01960 [Candidatus Saccharibacteria bacterium]|nr:hypothetical protein [Candidatus Saccharibacteria bacterium]